MNGRPITRHILQNDDVIEIAHIQIRYRNHKAIDGPSFDRTMIIQPSGEAPGVPAQAVGAYALATAKKRTVPEPARAWAWSGHSMAARQRRKLN
ncbi:MAG: hypothetical protein B7Y33_01115 [Hydrogenophilales bacterium 16-62-9]|nr:MAG: hypothetical protein B7Y33_01115 [Hydrogenophilales bacterium 16-62-9]